MKSSRGLNILFLLAGCQSLLAKDLPTVTLSGLVRLPDEEEVVLELRGDMPSPRRYILKAGQRDGGLEVLGIHAEEGAADLAMKVSTGETSIPPSVSEIKFDADGKLLISTVRFPEATNRLARGETGLIFLNTDWRDVLNFYSRFSNRTLLHAATLPGFKLTLKAVARDRQEAAAILEQALLAKGISSIPDGDKFLALLRTSDADNFKPRSSELTNVVPVLSKSQLPVSANQSGEAILPGMINFLSVEPKDVAMIYAELVGRKFDRSQMPPCPSITFRTQTPMRKEEALYALDTIFAFGGVKMENVGDDMMRLVPLAGENK